MAALLSRSKLSSRFPAKQIGKAPSSAHRCVGVSRLFILALVFSATTVPSMFNRPKPDSFAVPLVVQTPARTAAADSMPDSLKKPPISTKRRAFLMSLLLPVGYAQSRLNRPVASMVFATVGGVLSRDGTPRRARLPANGDEDIRDRQCGRWPYDRSHHRSPRHRVVTCKALASPTPVSAARQVHYEDCWFVAMIFNHLLSGVDALHVSANLSDFNANLIPDRPW